MREAGSNCKRGKANGFWLFTSDFRDGVKRLKDDEVGVYILFLTVLYETSDGRLLDDDAEIADDIRRDIRVWRRVRARLLALGKIELIDGYLSNPKATREIEKREGISEARSEAGKLGGEASGRARQNRSDAATKDTSGEDQPDISQKSAGSSQHLPQNNSKQSAQTNETDEAKTNHPNPTLTIRGSGAASAHAREGPSIAPPVVWTQRLAELRVALGDRLNRTSGGLETWAPLKALTEPATGEPCDWDGDVIPAIHAAAANALKSGKPLFSWAHPAIAEQAIRNRDRRLAGLPAPSIESLNDDASNRTQGRYRTSADEQRAASEASIESWGRVLDAVGAGRA